MFCGALFSFEENDFHRMFTPLVAYFPTDCLHQPCGVPICFADSRGTVFCLKMACRPSLLYVYLVVSLDAIFWVTVDGTQTILVGP